MIGRRLDVKSLVIGLLLGVCAMLALGQAPANQQPGAQSFQITAISEPRGAAGPPTMSTRSTLVTSARERARWNVRHGWRAPLCLKANVP